MGDVGHKFLLVVLRPRDLAGHVIQAGRQVTNLVVTFHLEFIVHVPGGVLLRGIGNLAQGDVHHFREKNQDDQGQQEQDNQGDIGNVQHAVAGNLDFSHAAVYDHIALDHVTIGNGRKNAYHLLVKVSEEVIYHVIGAAGGSGVEIFDGDLFLHV